MKYFFIVMFFPLLFGACFTQPAFAQDVRDCAEGTINCYCPPEITVDHIGRNPFAGDDAVTPEETCFDLCVSIDDIGFGDATHAVLQCEVDGAITVVYQKILDDTVDPDVTETDSFVGDIIGPPLGVQIPGFDNPVWTITGDSVSTNVLGEYVQAVYGWLISAGVIVAVFMIMIGGVQYSLARGDPGRAGKAKEQIVNAIIGLVLLLGAYSIAFLIDPDTVAFESLTIDYIEGLEFVPNETPFNTPLIAEGYTLSSEPAEGGEGWNGVPMYDQRNFQSTRYGEDLCFSSNSGNVASSGCGATSYAMAASYLSGRTIDPPSVAGAWEALGSCPDAGTEYGERCRACKLGDCESCNGTFGFAFINSNLQRDLRLRGESLGELGRPLSTVDKLEILELLENGELIISSYTQPSGNGHFVLLVGLDDDGNILVNNPYGGLKEVRDPEHYWTVAKSFYHIY